MEASGVRRNLIAFTALALVAGALVLPATALGAPPVLTAVGHTDRHPTATWQLPPGVESRVAEVATSPEIASDGYFFFENVQAFDTLESTQTSWVYGSQLDPGTYYVHIAGYDPSCAYDTCPGREWSETRILVISAPPSNSARPVLSGKVRAGKILTALPGTWGGTAPMTYSYQWQRCDLAGRSCRGIPGATSSTYQLVSADAGSTVRVAVTASNGAGSAVAYSRARAIAGVVVGVGTGMKPWRVGMAYRRGVEFLGSTAYPLNSGSGCSLGPLTASRIDRYPGVRASWQNRHLIDVATKRIGDRSSAGFKIGIARLRAVRARHPRAIFDRTPPRRFRLGSKSVVVVRTFPPENYVALTYWFNSRGTLVALESEAGGC